MNRLVLFVIATLVATPALAGAPEPAPAPVASPRFASPEHPIVSVQDNDPWLAPSGKAELMKVAQGANAFLAMLKMEPGAVVPVHRDATEEYILFLSGGGIITINGTTTDVSEGSAVYMAPDAEVTFTAGGSGAVVFQVFAGPQPAVKYDSWTAPDDSVTLPNEGEGDKDAR
jgi:quercetin dioxygenase-like cupin family protein